MEIGWKSITHYKRKRKKKKYKRQRNYINVDWVFLFYVDKN